jgi:hypothetical protein
VAVAAKVGNSTAIHCDLNFHDFVRIDAAMANV